MTARGKTAASTRRLVPLLAAAALVSGGVVATHGDAATTPPRVTAVLAYTAGTSLRQLDARTLKPVRRGWSRAVAKGGPVAVSPSGSRIAAVSSGRVGRLLVLDTATGRILRTYSGPDGSALYWLGGDTLGRGGDGFLVSAHHGVCWSHGCGNEYEVVGSDLATTGYAGGAEVAALEHGLVIQFDDDPTELVIYRRAGELGVALTRMPKDSPLRIVADVAHDRLFGISRDGLVAQIKDAAHRPAISYHRVDLNGRAFEAAWAGSGRIALWGPDGLITIDIRSWTTSRVAKRVVGLVATPFGLATWTDDPAGGLTVYGPGGRQRLRVLSGKRVRAARAVGGFLYADVDAGRYFVNLRTGRVVGPLRSKATIVTPSLVPIP